MNDSTTSNHRRTVVIAAIDDAMIDAGLSLRSMLAQQNPDLDIVIVDVTRAVAPTQSVTDARGVHRMVLDPAIPIVADAALRASALLAEWIANNVAYADEAVLILPADGGVAHFAVAQRAQQLASSRSSVAVYLSTAPAIAAIGHEQMLNDVRVLELAATTRQSIERADVLLCTPAAHGALGRLDWKLPSTLVREVDVNAMLALIALLLEIRRPAQRRGDTPLVSVCVTHYERPELLAQTLASIRRQDYPAFEVVLVDDGSKSAAAVRMLDELEEEFAARNWKIVRQENRYLGAARNSAVRAARGDMLLFIDDDDCMRPDYIAQFVRAAVSTNADVVTCFLEYFEGRDTPADGTRVHHRWVMPGPIGAGTLVQNTFGGANGLVRRAAYERVGGYTEDHGVGFEDWEFYNRLLAAGARFEVVPRPLLWCRWGIGGMQASAQRHAQQKARAARPAREAMPSAWRELPALVQGLHAQNRDLIAHLQKLEQQLASATSTSLAAPKAPTVQTTVNASGAKSSPSAEIELATDSASAGVEQRSKPAQTTGVESATSLPRITAVAGNPRRRCHVWHTEGLGLSGILSWMWRLRDQFAPRMNLDVRLVDLAVLPYGFQQAGSDPSTFYDERIATSQEFLSFLQRTVHDVHVVNHAFAYLRSLVEQLGADVLRGMRLVGICHTDQEYYYSNLEQLAPVLRSIIAVSPTCAATLAKRIPAHAHKIVTLPAWAVELPGTSAPARNAGEPLRLLYTGRILQFQKRVFDLVELATRLRAAKVNATLTLVGDGPDREELERRFKQAGGKSIPVRFEAVRPPWEMEALLESHHAFVQVSEFEGASVSLMEALAHGLVPIVTSTRSGHDLLQSDVNALTAPVGDMKRLCAQLALLSRDPARHARLASAARETAERYLEELAYPDRFASLVHEVAA